MATSPSSPPQSGCFVSLLRFGFRLCLAFVKLALLFVLVAGIAGAWLYYRYAGDLPDPAWISEYRSFETTRIYARDEQTLLYEIVDPAGGRRTPVSLDQIPDVLEQATIAVEDASFYENPGVDLRGILRALWLNYQNQEIVSGGSTITQQLVRNILLSPEERTDLSYERKFREAILAYRVGRYYSKDQILNLYLNEVYYGAQAYGVEAAAQAYFGKHVWELSPAEATLIAGLPQSPSRLNPFENLAAARARQRVTLNLMVKAGYLSHHEADALYAEPLSLLPRLDHLRAPHFVFYVRDLLRERYGAEVLHRGGLRVITSIDPYWQAEATRIAHSQIAQLRRRNAQNAGVVMLNPNGEILAMVGSVDYADVDGQVNVTLAPRQPGSALKPIVYAAALQHGWTPATVIWDTPTTFTLPDGTIYQPNNYDNAWHGPQRLRMALANSLNIPAVKAIEFVGVADFIELARRLGISTFTDPLRYGLPMALGSNEVRLLELSAVYNTFRNQGRRTPPVAILKIVNSRGEVLERWQPQPGEQVLGSQGPQIAYLITSILSDNQARRFMFGANNVMELADGRPAAVKTGTSNDWRDSWAVGYTPNVTVGVWVGNNDNAPMQEIAGANGAGQIWRELMQRFHRSLPPQPFAVPANIVETPICALTGGRAGPACPDVRNELFVAGSGPQEIDITSRVVRVAGDGNCLAASYTPPEQIREVSYPIYPPEFQDWVGAASPPTAYCPPPMADDQTLAMLRPVSASGVFTGTQLYVAGTVRAPYVLEVASGRMPADDEWRELNRGQGAIVDGLLGVWSTAGLEPGVYTLRLRVTTSEGITEMRSRQVRYRP
jgi:1A family penicillin-binding protein